ncbi:PREDICTED: DNA-directed RNA polymerase III subunit RPC9-like [Amphimedon queenslandica]|uniref:DNA-directed RNA polymerase III subunit RPC9 n=1 Tax=Amphimedon queenslandica TaxID=400682 RepID=A0A1X7TZ07_AMPQE|nr:PREDICTED: DNA-directed RNA polymerase III subunit RPC9-like [Amphimedon queenslandica]|eukprot:XP_019856999.1 PREDICTED: DNA-directed RNA polymerase III subunit RPC9-like [Amphimedon queenslandica]
MEVINDKVAMLSNYEVYKFLHANKDQANRCQDLATISYETKKYLSSTPCIYQSPDCISKFLESLSKYKLTKAEKLQLVNLRPTQPVELQLVIEEIEERFSEEEISDIIDLVTEHLPISESSEETGDNNES